MKSYIKLLLLSGVLVGATACTDLDTEIKTQYTEFPDNPIAAQAKLEACYYYLQKESGLGRNYWEGVMLQGDEMMGISFNNGYYDNGRLALPSIHGLKPDTPGVGMMEDLLSGISYCNTVILEIGGAEGKDDIVAPVRAIRAFYHFMMMDLYGDIPLLKRSAEKDTPIERAPRADVARWIEEELLEIIPQLTEANNADTYGRPNKWMAKALLAKLYLNWGVYTCGDVTKVTNDTSNDKLDELVAVCDDIINSGIFEVGKGYRKKFFPNNGVHIKDFIYAMNFDPVKNTNKYEGGHQLDRFMTFKKANNCDNGPWGFLPAKSLAGAYVLVPECVDRFNLPGDERNQVILKGPQYVADYTKNYEFTETPIMFQGQQVNYTKEITFVTTTYSLDHLDVGADSEAKNIMKGCHLGKYPSIPEDYTDRDRLSGNDIPIFRYADILLSKAEAILRGAKATMGHTPASLMNEVRDCSSAPHVEGTPTLQELLDERGREFICEMWRRQDLIRFGQFENDWGVKNEANPGAKTELWRRLLPVPQKMMETNTNWKQNFGY
ncbi:RagB/SusD family nutrient uptake outer membrane protein [Bacteroides intestinalis]|uniref:RagB/SusD family nutrient uptake outer membrane protein n=1 Tax=Bacteroides intestinalis TaxID=329854 RepID=A0A412XR99_9BACE|nr:RagB/SusD family nutrient uptake outer membrane protein [Bacteroides intestinalis]RGV47667.1 RagB/SusD family nutrient uptake outer membrane protein [Bacteroides intestinalis]RHA53302.1 RagB/SusD family nutrient uptake outer membrane protein [Bacteroides intestinalis]